MEYKALEQIANEWQQMTSTVMDLQDISLSEIQGLLKDTYQALTAFHNDVLIPKEVCKILLEMEDFLYFASLMEEKEVGESFYHWREIFVISTALKTGFLEGKYECEFPHLQVCDDKENVHIIDVSNIDWNNRY